MPKTGVPSKTDGSKEHSQHPGIGVLQDVFFFGLNKLDSWISFQIIH